MSFKVLRLLLLGFVLLVVTGISFAGEQKNKGVEIVATPESGTGPIWVSLKPKIRNLKEPLQFNWYFGDGEESANRVPPPHFYKHGKSAVVLEVTDGNGKRYSASVTIDAASPG